MCAGKGRGYDTGVLILFDIDGTILRTEGAGVASMLDAGRSLFAPEFTFDGVEVSGRLDHLIWTDLAARNGVEATDDNHTLFRETYGRLLAERLRTSPTARALPGVLDLLTWFRSDGQFVLGLLTGNYPETGQLKVRAAGVDPAWFPVAAWGIDGPTRRHLPPVAISRAMEAAGREVSPAQTVIIGDTPHDVDCARAHGCLSIAVATGRFSVDDLRSHGPDLVVADLADTAMIRSWIESRIAAGGDTASTPGAMR